MTLDVGGRDAVPRNVTSQTVSDESRLNEIFSAYSGSILSYAMRRLMSADDAADVVAETFTIAWRRIADVPAGEQARPWLYGVARRVLANQRRTTSRRLRLEDRLKLEACLEVDERATGLGDGAAATRRALSYLNEQDRELLTLTAWDGLDSGHLGIVLGCTPGAARVRLHRARRRFERLLAEDEV